MTGRTARRAQPRRMAGRRIGELPEVGRSGPARTHLAGVWLTARSGVVSGSELLWERVGRDERAFGGQVDLAFLGTLAGHLHRCELCWREWADGQVPVVLLTEAVQRRRAGDVLRPLLREIRASRRRSGRRREI